ncbi:hypothetical protein Clacol_001104 [Clathrus columnatus]|uniref:14-3-3 domain-containing protein n=1 Tax=Clathrus columnatus TaxID=1419009 RepID=A0AAV5A111_9AGAM|nr:hypothetical protein Clacol_001104 [Clathrus columnatus]
MISQRQQLAYLARVAEQAERYDDMLEYMDQIALLPHNKSDPTLADECLASEERKLFSNAYKTVTGNLRKAWRMISSLEERGMDRSAMHSSHLPGKTTANLRLTGVMKLTIKTELEGYCNRVLKHVECRFLPRSKAPDAKVFYHKMTGDYHRYLAEISSSDARQMHIDKSLEGYKSAWRIADSELLSTDPTRLGLALNFSVFYFEQLNSPNRACHLAKYAFDSAIENLDNIPEDDAPDSIRILQLLKDNLTLWIENEHSGYQLESVPENEQVQFQDEKMIGERNGSF